MRSPLGLVAAMLMASSMLIVGRAQAAPISTADGTRTAADTLRLVERAQYVWNGRSYCWYDAGWKGPGWYVCSYGPWVSGLWWGGSSGWHNWHWHGHKGHHVEHHAKKHGGGKHNGGHHVSHHKGGGHHVSHHRGGGRHVSHHRGGGGGHHVRRGGGGHHVSHRGGHRGGGGRGGGRRSDIRLKEGIVPLARLNNGLELYRFRYKGKDHTAYVGVMAQQVQKIEPSAVWRDRDGYLVVNYDRIGLKFMTWREWLERTRSN